MDKTLKIAHLLGLALFLGSIPGHIVLGALADPGDPAAFALLMHAKYVSVLALTLPGLGLALATGVALMLRRNIAPQRVRWLAVKLALVALITANAAFVLVPAGRDMAAAAREGLTGGTLPARFATLEAREGAFGAANLLMILAVIGLAVLRPSLTKATR